VIYLQPEFPVSQQVAPGTERAQQMTVGSGRKLFEFWVSRSQYGHCLKTFLDLILSGPAWYSKACWLRWKVKGMRSSRSGYRLVPSTPHIGASVSGLLPTPEARDYMPPHQQEYIAAKKAQGHGMSNLNDTIALLPTPAGLGGGQKSRGGRRKAELLLAGQIGRSIGLKLQPGFVEWMMGFPPGWTKIEAAAELAVSLEKPDCARSATQLCHKSHGKSSG
jgi:hypothetical protein